MNKSGNKIVGEENDFEPEMTDDELLERMWAYIKAQTDDHQELKPNFRLQDILLDEPHDKD